MQHNSDKIRLLIVDDHAAVCKGLADFLETIDQFLIVAEASNGPQAVHLCYMFQPDVVLLSLRMAGLDAVTVTQLISKFYGNIRVITLASDDDDRALVEAALGAGAVACLPKNVTAHELLDAINAAYAAKLPPSERKGDEQIMTDTPSFNNSADIAESKGVNDMFNFKRLHKEERGQAALETAIILIAFVVVAAVFAFTILSAGNASTDKGKAAISSGLQSVQSSLAVKGAVIAEGGGSDIQTVTFTVGVAGSASPIQTKDIVVNYRDDATNATVAATDVSFLEAADNTTAVTVLNPGDQVNIKVTISSYSLAASKQFTIEVKPPVGAVLQITRTTPASLAKVMDLQ